MELLRPALEAVPLGQPEPGASLTRQGEAV
jgi:hypothetical protein